jgi:NDP-sugar pyrophosphorylase family protein
MIRRIVAWLSANGVTDIVLNLHHRPETITRVLGDGRDLSAGVRYSWEQPVVLGSAGGPRQALPIIGVNTFLLINGDTLTDVDLGVLGDVHAATGALVTLALVPNREPHRYGGVLLDDDRRVVGFVPRGPNAEGSYHFTGVQVVHASVFEPIAAGQHAQSVGGVYDALIAAQPGALRGSVSDAAFFDVGSVATYWSTSWSFAKTEGQSGVMCGRRVHVEPSARISQSILWDDIDVDHDSVIEECIVTDGVRVPPGARFHHGILLPGPDGAPRAVPMTL